MFEVSYTTCSYVVSHLEWQSTNKQVFMSFMWSLINQMAKYSGFPGETG